MEIITGQSARKENFWKREKEIKEILHKINSHNFKSLVFKGKSTIFDGFPVDKGRQNPHYPHYPQSAGGQIPSIFFWKNV